MARYMMQGVSSSDGTMKSWLSSTRDFAGADFPGPGTALYPAVLKAIRDNLMTATGDGTQEGDSVKWDGAVWIPEKDAIIPDVDYTGGTPARGAFMALLLRVRQGAWIKFADGIVNLKYPNTTDHMFADLTQNPASDRYKGIMPQGVTITGSPQGWKHSNEIYNNGYTNSGTLFKIYASTGNAAVAHAGDIWRMGVNTALEDIMGVYADQTRNPTSTTPGAAGSFTPYGYFLHAVQDYHGVTFQNIQCHNPYRLLKWQANGGMFENFKGFPLLRGITYPRCGAAPHVSNVQFNGVGSYLDNASVAAWVKINGTAIMLDGVEGYYHQNVNCLGYARAREFWDEDNDQFPGVYGTEVGADLEGCSTVVLVHTAGRTANVLCNLGGKFLGGQWVPEVAGYGIDMADAVAPAGSTPFNNRARIHLIGTTMHSSIAGMSRGAWVRSSSYGIIDWDGGEASQIANDLARNDSTNAGCEINLRKIGSESGTRRIAGVGTVNDIDGRVR